MPACGVEAGRERKGGEREREHRDTISLSVFFLSRGVRRNFLLFYSI